MSFNEKVKKVNEILDSFGGKAIQVDTTKAYKSVGYRPQYVIDAMNESFGIGNWKHEVHKVDEKEVETGSGKKRTVISVLMSITVRGDVPDDKGKVEEFQTGPQAGEAFVINGGYGNAMKSAITDGLGKCLSLLSVGQKAYRGLLEASSESEVIKANNNSSTDLDIAETVSKGASFAAPSSTKPRFGGFKSKGGNGSAVSEVTPITVAPEVKAPVETQPTVDAGGANTAPQARFRSSGLSAPTAKE
jgi:hypothetical protein